MVSNLGAFPNPGPLKSKEQIELWAHSVSDWVKTTLVQSWNDRLVPEIAALPTEDTGEVNTASSAGAGASLVQAKSGVDLPFRSITGSDGITDTENTNEVDLALDIVSLTSLAVAPADDDTIIIYDNDAALNKSIEVADFLSVGVADAQTAASSGTQGDAQMATGIRVARFTTVGSGHSMTLPNPSGAGDSCIVMNDGANALKVWADTGDTLEGGTDISLATSGRAHFVSMTSTAWYQLY